MRARDRERNRIARFVLDEMLRNWEIATAERRPMCADTGLPRYYVRVGNEASVEGGFVALERALRRATADATAAIPLRPNRVHPLTRKDHDNNVGVHAPEVTWAFEPGADWVDITTVHKGGLFGSDYRMLFPGRRRGRHQALRHRHAGRARQAGPGLPAGHRGDRHRRLEGHVHAAGQGSRVPARGRQPQPRAGDRPARGGADGARQLHRHRRDGVRRDLAGGGHPHRDRLHPHRRPAGRHPPVLPVLAPRHRALHPDGRVEFRSDPDWFTDYYRREGIE